MNAFERGFFDELQKTAASDFAVAGLGGRTRSATAPLGVRDQNILEGGLIGGALGIPLEMMTGGNTYLPAITSVLGGFVGSMLPTRDKRTSTGSGSIISNN